jgi:hypothetical protein
MTTERGRGWKGVRGGGENEKRMKDEKEKGMREGGGKGGAGEA